MIKRAVQDVSGGSVLPSPGLGAAPVLDLMCSHFVLTLAARRASSFNVRRDLNSVVSLAGRHLVWPAPVLARLREFLARRCKATTTGAATRRYPRCEFLARYGAWRGPYEEGTLFFYLDEYAKDQPKDLISVLGHRRLADTGAEEAFHAGREEHRCAGRACCSSTRPSARCCCTARWHGTSATCAASWSNSRSATPPRPTRPLPSWRA
jgi:hypothetical protein